MGSEDEKDISLTEHCQRIARSGGLSHSDAKRAAARKNLERAWLARRLKRHGLPLPPPDHQP